MTDDQAVGPIPLKTEWEHRDDGNYWALDEEFPRLLLDAYERDGDPGVFDWIIWAGKGDQHGDKLAGEDDYNSLEAAQEAAVARAREIIAEREAHGES